MVARGYILNKLKQLQIINASNNLCINFEKKLLIKYPEIVQQLNEATSFLRYSANLKTRIYCLIKNITVQPLCKICQKPTTMRFEGRERFTFATYCSRKCCATDQKDLKQLQIREATIIEKYGSLDNFYNQRERKRLSTNKEKYGVEHAMLVPSIQQKQQDRCRQTNTIKYGVDNVFKLDNIQEKANNTVRQKYGVDNVSQNEEILEKKKQNNIQKYGVSNPTQLKEIKEKIKNTKIQKYGHYHFQSSKISEQLVLLERKDWLEHQYNKLHKSALQIAKELNVGPTTVLTYLKKHGIEIEYGHSKCEAQVCEFLKENGIPIVKGNRKLIYPHEIDIFLPDLKLAIEINGVYWHSECQGKDQKYHLSKMQQCNKQGIRLIQILDSEWYSKQEIVKSRISSLLNKNQTIHARKTNITKLTPRQTKEFMDDNHIQGAAFASTCYGLMQDGEIVAAMSFGQSRFNKNVQWELVRYANKLYTNVVGGASKLFQHFVNTHTPNTVVSYCDLRWNTGKLYDVLGFVQTHTAQPNYFYFLPRNTNILYSRQTFQKHKLDKKLEKFDPKLTEWENMQANGYDRIWDCGNSVWMWTKISN